MRAKCSFMKAPLAWMSSASKLESAHLTKCTPPAAPGGGGGGGGGDSAGGLARARAARTPAPAGATLLGGAQKPRQVVAAHASPLAGAVGAMGGGPRPARRSAAVVAGTVVFYVVMWLPEHRARVGRGCRRRRK